MNTKTNEQILNDYYNCIHRKDIFIKLLDRESEYWAVRFINKWKHERNEELLMNRSLIVGNSWLLNINNQLAKLISEILTQLKMIFDRGENRTIIENCNLEIRLKERLQYLNELSNDIKIIKNTDQGLALEIQEYCLNAFDLMINFVKRELLIDIESLPSFYLIQEVIGNIKSSIDFEKVKFITESKNAKAEHSKKVQKNGNAINAPTLALFCNLINETGIDKKEESENVKDYCKRVCDKYSFTYTDRVRQNFSGNKTKKNRKEFSDKVLPLLDDETKGKIEKHLDSKDTAKQNMYA